MIYTILILFERDSKLHEQKRLKILSFKISKKDEIKPIFTYFSYIMQNFVSKIGFFRTITNV